MTGKTDMGSSGLRRRSGIGIEQVAVSVEGTRLQFVLNSQTVVVRNGLTVRPHVDGGMSFQAKSELQGLDGAEERNGLFFGNHGQIVSPLTPSVNCLTNAACKVPDMKLRTLAERAVLARERAGFSTPADAADEIGCSRPLVNSWETTAYSIGAKYLLNAARAYKVRPEWLQLKTDDDGYPWEPAGTEQVANTTLSPAIVSRQLVSIRQALEDAVQQIQQLQSRLTIQNPGPKRFVESAKIEDLSDPPGEVNESNKHRGIQKQRHSRRA